MESAKSETMPDPLSEWDPYAMISLKNELLEQVTTEFHKLYEEKSRKTSYAENCLTRAVDVVRSTFLGWRVSRLTRGSSPMITSRMTSFAIARFYMGLIPIYGV